MPYTASQLSQFYTTLTVGRTPGATLAPLIAATANQDAAGQITDVQAFATISSGSNDVRSTTDVAVATYALFTGATPTQGGINYLVNNPGSGYNTDYYNGVGGTPTNLGVGGFDTENRYYNAAINLAATTGAVGNAAFVATYGGLSLAQTISTAYNQIIGVSAVGATAAAAAITSITGSIPYFQALAAQRVVAGNSIDIATKAIIVAYILEEGIKADVGTYARALDGFNFGLATSNAVFNTNLLATYGSGGSAFNPAAQPLLDGQTVTVAAGATLTTVGAAPLATAAINAGANSTLAFTGDIASNTGQIAVNVAGAATNVNDILNLNYTGQITSVPHSVIAPNVELVNVTATVTAGAPAGSVLSLDLEDASLTALTIRGNESVAYNAPLYALPDGTFSLGALTSINAAQATAPVVVDVSNSGAPNTSASGGVTVTGTTGADTFMVRNYATITGGGGNDTIMVSQPTSISAVSVVTDDHAGNVLGFAGLRVATFRSTAITATSVQNGLDQAAALGPGTASYFQVGGDTYVVADNSTAATFQAGNDFAIRLIGVHNLATSTITAQGALVLGG